MGRLAAGSDVWKSKKKEMNTEMVNAAFPKRSSQSIMGTSSLLQVQAITSMCNLKLQFCSFVL